MKISISRVVGISQAFFILSLGNAGGIEVSPGKISYAQYCSDCHSMTLRGSAHGSALRGGTFVEKWRTLGFERLYDRIVDSMPPGKISQLSPETYRSIYQYILAASDITVSTQPTVESNPSPTSPLSEESSGTSTPAVPIPRVDEFVSFSDQDTVSNLQRRDSTFKNAQIGHFDNVDKATVNTPPDADWLSWRRTLDGQGYSPLRIINRDNVWQLGLAWSLSMHGGSNQITPLVSQGIMFLTHPNNMIQALDAATGELIWTFQHKFPEDAKTLGGPTRNIAIYGDKIFMATYDAALIAVDLKSGKLLWKTVKADYKEGFTHTSGPIIANGVLVSGINGCEFFVRDGCFITGHDPDSGKELWRTSTIALPGDPNDKTWGNVEPVFRGGGDTWIPGSYDPELNLFYIGISQAKPWVAASRGMSPKQAALYTNSTLALNPNTGEIKWYFQHIPGETIDMEVAFERILVDEGKGGEQKVLYTIGKDGILWKLNRENGEFVALFEIMPQNIYQSINRSTGELVYRQDILDAEIDQPFSACPGIYGGHNWQAASYDKKNHAMIVPMHQLCSDMVGREVDKEEGGGGYGGDSRTYEMPGIDGKIGKLVSIGLDPIAEKWAHEQRAMFLTSSLSTGGNLIFIGDLDRYFKAFDAKTGDLLWQTRLGTALHGFPITYSVNGKQYVSVTTGMGVFRALTATLNPEIYQPGEGNAIYVFELPSPKQ